MLVNDGGDPPPVPDDYPLPVVRVDLAENRGRAARGRGRRRRGHAATSWPSWTTTTWPRPSTWRPWPAWSRRAGVRVAYTDAAVAVYELGEPGWIPGGWVCRERRLPYSRDFDPDVLLVDNYIPFNTLLIERRLFAEVGPFDPALPFFEDWDFLIRLSALTPFHHLRAGDLRVPPLPRRRPPHLRGAPARARRLPGGQGAGAGQARRAACGRTSWRGRWTPCAPSWSTEREAPGAAARRELRRDSPERIPASSGPISQGLARGARGRCPGERFALEERYYAANGELADAPAGQRPRCRDRRCSGSTTRSSGCADDRRRADRPLGRTYAEIERLNGLIREMESTRAWRLHQWVQERTQRSP